MSKDNIAPGKVLITGATKGMGRAIAFRFARAGMDIAVTARTESDVNDLKQALQNDFPDIDILALAADVSSSDDIDRLAERIRKEWGTLDLLVNNAGIFLQDNLLTEPESNLDRSLQVNVYGPYRLCRELVPLMIDAGKGHIINICSVASKISFPNAGSYVISKHALLGLTRALRMELKEKHVKVTALMPGATWTASWEGADIPKERIMPVEDIAEAVFAVWSMGPSTVVEEMQLRPQLGDV
ncbi:SDR family NAD(P)-dependent oxidoreductase [Flavilitoribacter nigricans]|uniref:Short-chain dehydrogenase n=1 Tax=Flavilitoribacter nigricans (strain ATCC 23147 / DSM 23189 / NBRC 102662 / NCIMB 1420 / SS-2) TaxID=1122177 RepID=A0A2D0N0Q8_FLAN2|nr:SDR family oxidoreductase [Flavilitoribacter nigricans]PHN02075.1 short-chain dehydrogenase [Flavilitoribacter nigricans DSM 23189 = NBRC 102662]